MRDVRVTGDRAEMICRAETEEEVFRRDIIPARQRAKRRAEQPEVYTTF